MVDFFKELKVNYAVSAILCVLLGLVLMIWPGTTTQIVCMLLGIVLLAYGVIQIAVYLFNQVRTIISQGMLLLGIVFAVIGVWILLRHLCKGNNGNVIRQIKIHVLHHFIHTHLCIHMKICHLPKSMDPGIRPAGTLHLCFFPGHLKKQGFQFSLNGVVRACLFLPSLISGPLILQ